MTPKEKAKELVDNFRNIHEDYIDSYQSIPCAIIAVDEILQAIDWHEFEVPNKQLEYWQEVKQEIEAL